MCQPGKRLRCVAESVKQEDSVIGAPREADPPGAGYQLPFSSDRARSNSFVSAWKRAVRSAISELVIILSFRRIASFTDGSAIVDYQLSSSAA